MIYLKKVPEEHRLLFHLPPPPLPQRLSPGRTFPQIQAVPRSPSFSRPHPLHLPLFPCFVSSLFSPKPVGRFHLKGPPRQCVIVARGRFSRDGDTRGIQRPLNARISFLAICSTLILILLKNPQEGVILGGLTWRKSVFLLSILRIFLQLSWGVMHFVALVPACF